MAVDLLKDKEFVKQLKKDKDYEVFLYFIRITANKNVTIWKLSFDKGMEVEFMNWFLAIDECIPQEDFSPSKGNDKFYGLSYNDKLKVETEEGEIEVAKYPTISSIIEEISSDSSTILDNLKGTKLHNLSGYAVKIKKKAAEDRIIYFSQFEKFSSLKKGAGVMTNITNNTVKKLKKEETVGLKPIINSYIGKENKFLVTRKNNFESMFKMSDIYIEEAERIMKAIPNLSSTFTNYSDFEECIKKNSRLSKRVASLELKKDRVKQVCSDIEIVKKAISEVEYKDKIGKVKIENDKIVYEEENIDQIITLLSDLAAQSYITSKKFVAESE